ncbi:MAG: hypothetical protein Q8R81_12875 [Novosphingobium sp.]|uniref:hypothetical protein n=1 Tax=Novosphingobium sp. TaxID=1874826 RepID=UPI002735D760|nr:hypothetical protein [Novosphingobium sp.]MDP3551271.1 hypothetical protein [Novosphingobium sp.]
MNQAVRPVFARVIAKIIAIAALVAGSASAGAATGDSAQAYPGEQVLSAFRGACSSFADFGKARDMAVAQGWTEIPVDDTTPGGRLVRFGEEMAGKSDDITMLKGSLLRRDVAGRELYLAISGAKLDGATAKGCRMYDFTAALPLSDDALVAFMGRGAESRKEPIAGFTIATWNPGMVTGQSEFEAAHLAQGTTLPMAMPISGVMLKAQTVEIDKP